MNVVDVRTDAVTRPTEEMWRAMREARLGWSLVGEDENVNELERLGAEVVGKEAAVFTPTGTMANLAALMTHTRPGDQIVLDADSHILWSEEQGYAQLCGLAARALPHDGGFIAPEVLTRSIDDSRFGHRPRTALVCVENTHNGAGGTVVDVEAMDAMADVVEARGIPLHADGARLLNAAVALDVPAARLAQRATSVSVNLNKGLSSPMGALLCGSEEFVEAARVNLRRLGSRLSKAGMEAAAGVVALRTMVPQLADDNARARRLAEKLAGAGVDVDPRAVQTNILMCRVPAARLARAGVLAYPYRDDAVRIVTHRHVDDDAVERIAAAVSSAATG